MAVAWTAGVLLTYGCEVKTKLGSTCSDGGCVDLPACSAAVQQLPASHCDGGADLLCYGAPVEDDTAACSSCEDMLQDLHVASPLGACACRSCAAQLRACFASAQYEPDGDALRDTACQAIVECAWAAGCSGSECYCGQGVERHDCLTRRDEGNLAAGFCAQLIESQTDCPSQEKPGTCMLNLQFAKDGLVRRASDVAVCVTGDPLLVGATVQGDPIVPMCKFEDFGQ